MKYLGFRPETDNDKKHWPLDRISASFPSSAASDLRQYASPRHDQKFTNSCVAQSVVKALELKRIMKHGHKAHVDLSRLAVYYLSRELMRPSEVKKDEGTHISLAADVLRRFGTCRENQDPTNPNDTSYWPFDVSKVKQSPSWLAMKQAYLHKISAWYKIYSHGNDRVDDCIRALRAGCPIVYGTVVTSAWEPYNDSKPLSLSNGRIFGRHATTLVGWDPSGWFWGENSWGSHWGNDGFYRVLPEVIADSDSSDFIVFTCGWEPWAEVKV